MSFTPYRRIFVIYPRGKQTGGPEALHQLVDSLRRQGQDAYLVPTRGTRSVSRVPAYRVFDAPEALLEDQPDCAIVFPEMALSDVRHVKRAKLYCWWLSVDNSALLKAERKLVWLPRTGFRSRLKRLKHSLLVPPQAFRRALTRLDSMNHLTQSQYAWSFLYSRFNIVSTALSDYTDGSAFPASPSVRNGKPMIAYNWEKGGEVVEQLRRDTDAAAQLEWRPIRGMSRAQVSDTLGMATVYIDLGHHPGKDRMPREAALAGAVVLVARRGAGAYSVVIPIPWTHKIDMSDPIVDSFRALRAVLADVPVARAAQDPYRAAIRSEKVFFDEEVHAIFGRGELGADHGRGVLQMRPALGGG